MASSYPGGLDSFSTGHTDNSNEIIHAATLNDNADAINKIEAELGTDPKGSSSTVKARLANIQPLTGATAASRYVGGTASGSPATGTFAVGDFVIAQNGHVFICTAAGSPGTWVDAGSVSNDVTSVFSRTGAVVASSGDYTAAQITNAADKSSSSQQAFTGEIKSPDFVASGLTGATAASRYVGATTSGAPVSGTFAVGDYIVDQTGFIYVCTVAGTPGTWTKVGGGSGSSSPLTTKGDMWGFNTADARIPVGSNNQVLTADSTQALGVKWAAAGSVVGFVQIFDQTLSVATNSIDTGAGGVSSAYSNLMIYAVLQTDEAVARSVTTWNFNGDTAANYDRQFLSGASTTASAGTSLAQTGMTIFAHGASGTSGYPGQQQWFIPNYSGTTFFKCAVMHAVVMDASSSNTQDEIDAFGWRSTSAITRVSVSAPVGKNLVAGSRVTIYGMN